MAAHFPLEEVDRWCGWKVERWGDMKRKVCDAKKRGKTDILQSSISFPIQPQIHNGPAALRAEDQAGCSFMSFRDKCVWRWMSAAFTSEILDLSSELLPLLLLLPPPPPPPFVWLSKIYVKNGWYSVLSTTTSFTFSLSSFIVSACGVVFRKRVWRKNTRSVIGNFVSI